MNLRFRRLMRTFVTGSVAALPLVATVSIFTWTLGFVFAWLGPESLIGGALGNFGIAIGGGKLAGYVLGIALMLLAILALGLLVERGAQAGLEAAVESVVQRIPIVRNVYDTIERFVAMLSKRDEVGLRSMRPVWCHFGGPGGAMVLGLLSTPDPVPIGGKLFRAVLIPTAPVPIGGALIYVPDDWVTPANIGIEALTSVYVSMGVTSSDYLKSGDKA